MFSREEHSRLRAAFWTQFGQLMKPFKSEEGKRINWTNYKTGVKSVFFKMEADKKKCGVGIYLTHKDPDIQQLIFEQFEEMKSYLHSVLEEEWEWELHTKNEMRQTISRIYIEKEGVNMFKPEDQADIYEFLKPRMLKLDEFWRDTKEIFVDLSK
ncbi:DUF4268 domain-containing protein [Flammeovirga sp. MY04]|uniref:DUF4268 domain-containing protein n=1 Tax=Flammeovirga sp. MY04 TaxID=1191459 RepID=UPI00080638BC|nr:DUF4268 domain-containing protein [Flammeovirga sp. MY04]ANQ50777.1 DUF4268 domain-containing protein [Flammeovirga sp. MY04]